MQQKVDCLTREVYDLQETINWKDKKMGVCNKYGGEGCMNLEIDWYISVFHRTFNSLWM